MPPDLVARLGGRDLAAVASKAIQVFTMDDAGRPHPALLSYFEVVAKDATRLRLAVYGTSATSANIRRSGVLTLVVIDERVVYYVKTRASERAPVMRAARWNAAFECRVEQVLADEPNEKIEPGAYVAGGITYVNPGRAAELERAAAVLAELLE
jgi:flavin reductase (DIM6/NTAB) family NADH-FMN oxidoreductase RutF